MTTRPRMTRPGDMATRQRDGTRGNERPAVLVAERDERWSARVAAAEYVRETQRKAPKRDREPR